jgi:CRP-like cAMP-binding protein
MYDRDKLHRAPIFRDFAAQDIEAIVALGREQAFANGDEIFREGEPGRYLYIVLEGVVSIRCGDKYIAKCKVYEAFGEMAMLHQRARSATATAATAVRTLSLGDKEIASLLDTPRAVQFLLNIIEILSARLEIGNTWIANSLEAQRR